LLAGELKNTLFVESALQPVSHDQFAPKVMPSNVAGIGPATADGAGLSNVTIVVAPCAREIVAANEISKATSRYLFIYSSKDAEMSV
jgi:hypothetical protein